VVSVFVTGTDTDVGKTVVSAWLCLHLEMAYWKPVQTGTDAGSDTRVVAALAGAQTFPEAYRFARPLSPHAAAAAEGREIDPGGIALPRSRGLVVEGAGGVLVPLDERETIADLIVRLGLPAIVVARSTLGTINHTCLSLEALRERGAAVAGVILVGPPDPQNRASIERYGKVAVLAELPRFAAVTRAALEASPPPPGFADRLAAAAPRHSMR
jgi:dethiobiotin synthase